MQSLDLKYSEMKVLSCLSIVTILLCSLTNIAFSQYSKWEKDVTYHGVKFKKIRFWEGGNESIYANGIIKQKTIIDGYPCHKKITLTKDGKAKFFILAEDFEIAGNEFKKETQVIILITNHFKIHCLYNPVVQDYHIKRTNYKKLFFMGSTNFTLYPSGRLRYFQPVDEIEIQGVLCKPSPVRGGVKLYENGKLKECTSAKDQTINGVFCGKNYTVKFNENGKLFYAKKEKIFSK